MINFVRRLVLFIIVAIAASIGGIAKMIHGITSFVVFTAGALFLFVGLWDFLVWLFKADWRTTNGDVPLIALIVFIAVGILHVMLTPIVTWAERVEQWCDRIQRSN